MLLVINLVGCGGGDNGVPAVTRTGQVTVVVSWPAGANRLIPKASNSIRVEILQPSGEPLAPPQDVTINRPQTTATLTDVPAGDAILKAAAYPEADAQGVAQAAGEKAFTVVAGQTVTVPVTMDSTIASVAVTPNPASVTVNGTIQLTATAQDASGATVLVPTTDAFTWAVTAGGSVASVDGNGLVTGLAAGSATVQATEKESGVSGTTQVTVPPVPTVTITAPAVNATVSGNLTVNATVSSVTGVTGVEFKVNGTTFAQMAAATAVSATLDTTTVANGAATITVETLGNAASASVAVTVDNPTTGTVVAEIS
jgi:hypothetical protein